MDVETLIGRTWSALRQEARAFVASAPPTAFECATEWYGHTAWEVRMFAVLVLGGLAAHDPRALAYLRESCGRDPCWLSVHYK
jgi:hypothetical protein